VDDFDFYRLFKTLHVLAVILLGGGIIIETAVGILMARASGVQELRAYTKLSTVAEKYVMLPAYVLIAGFGYATAGRANIDVDVTWLMIAQILFYIAVAVSVLYLLRASMQIDRLARAAPDGPLIAEIAAELKKPGPPIAGGLLTLIYVFIVYLMVAKPAW
jgi:uncharacterized membrane protein